MKIRLHSVKQLPFPTELARQSGQLPLKTLAGDGREEVMGSKYKDGGHKHYREAMEKAKEFAKVYGLKASFDYSGKGHLKIELSNGVHRTTFTVSGTPRTDNSERWLAKDLREAYETLLSPPTYSHRVVKAMA